MQMRNPYAVGTCSVLVSRPGLYTATKIPSAGGVDDENMTLFSSVADDMLRTLRGFGSLRSGLTRMCSD